MSKKILLVTLLAAFALTGSLLAQEGQVPAPSELAGIRVTLEKIAGLLERQVETSSAELIFRRLALVADEIGPLQGELNGLRTALTGHEAGIAQAEAQLAALRSQEESGVALEGETIEALRLRTQSLSNDIAGRRKLLSILRSRASDLEGQIATKEGERDEWKRFLDQKLARIGR